MHSDSMPRWMQASQGIFRSHCDEERAVLAGLISLLMSFQFLVQLSGSRCGGPKRGTIGDTLTLRSRHLEHDCCGRILDLDSIADMVNS